MLDGGFGLAEIEGMVETQRASVRDLNLEIALYRVIIFLDFR